MRLGRTLGSGIVVLAVMGAVMFGFLLTGDDEIPAGAAGPLYEGTATVVQRGGGPAMVCGALADSDPPACANGLPISGLRWDEVDGHEHLDGARWAVAHLVAHYDGAGLSLAATPTVDEAPSLQDAVHFGTPCDPPEEGWAVTDPNRTDEAALGNVRRYADRQKDLGRHWVDREAFPGLGVQNFTFTAALDRHRLELAGLWGGPICVTESARALDELEALADDLGQAAEAAPAPVASVAVDPQRGAVRLVALIADPDFEAWARRLTGSAPTVIDALLQPSDSAQTH